MGVENEGTPVEGPWYETDEGAIERVTKARRESARFCEKFAEQATECMRFVAGHQWTDEESATLREEEKPDAALNWLSRLVSVVCGQQVANRQEVAYLGRSAEDHGPTEMMTNAARWVRDMGDEEYEESAAFRDLVITGMGWTVRSMEYDEDPEGMIKKERLDPRRVRWDASARRPSLADARWIQVDYWYTKDALKERWGEEVVGDIAMSPEATRIDGTDGSPHDADRAWRYEDSSTGVDQRNGEYRVIHHVEWCRHAQYDVVGDDGAMMTLDEEQFEEAKERAEKIGMPIPQHARRLKRVYYHVWTVGQTVLERGEAVLQTGMPYQCMTGLRDDETGLFYGLVRLGLDPQRFSNALFISTLHSIKTGAKGGLVVEDDAVENVRAFEDSWAKADSIAWVRPGALGSGKVQPKAPPVLAPQISQLMQFLVESIPSILGVAPELLAQQQPGQREVGIVEELRTQAGLTILTPWFDAVRLYMKKDGRILLEMMNRFIADGRLARIVGKEGEQYIPLVRAEGWERFDVSVEESAITRDVKKRTFMALMSIAPMMAQQGIPPPPSALDYTPLPQALVQEWKQMIQAQQSKPPEPSPQEKLEKMKIDGAMALEQQRSQTRLQEAEVDAARQTEIEMAQAAGRERESAATLALKREENAMKAQMMQLETVLDARLKTFESVLTAILKGVEAQQRLTLERDRTIAELRAEGSAQQGERPQ